MKIEQKRKKLFDFIISWENSVYTEEKEKERFYTYLGLVLQSRLLNDLVKLNPDDYPAYGIVGDNPLYEHMNHYDIDEIYNNYLKKNS